MSQTMTREKVSNEALYILKSLRENSRLGRSNKHHQRGFIANLSGLDATQP